MDRPILTDGEPGSPTTTMINLLAQGGDSAYNFGRAVGSILGVVLIVALIVHFVRRK